MATVLNHSQLATGVIPISGTPFAIYTNPDNQIKTYIKACYFHNNQANSSDLGVFIQNTGIQNRILNATLVSSETLEWDIAYNLTLTGSQKIFGSTTVNSGINYFIYGATE
jgi:hypothetical protein